MRHSTPISASLAGHSQNASVSRCDWWAPKGSFLFYFILFYLLRSADQKSTATTSHRTDVDDQGSNRFPDHGQRRWRRLQSGGLRIRISCSRHYSGALRRPPCSCWPSHTSRPCSWRIGARVSLVDEASPARRPSSSSDTLPSSSVVLVPHRPDRHPRRLLLLLRHLHHHPPHRPVPPRPAHLDLGHPHLHPPWRHLPDGRGPLHIHLVGILFQPDLPLVAVGKGRVRMDYLLHHRQSQAE